ncbi:MAG TPA: hypothetical protein VMM79_00670 [Longimicrobiales bacterium]|nr:hypothetical protein [Longimicrobiales bacterium]
MRRNIRGAGRFRQTTWPAGAHPNEGRVRVLPIINLGSTPMFAIIEWDSL